MRRHLGFAAIVLVSATAGMARAQAPEGAPPAVPGANAPSTNAAADVAGNFGQVGQIVITGDVQVSFLHNSGSAGGSSNTLTLLPSASYFIAPNVSVGAGLIVQHGSTSVNAGIVSVNVDQTAIGLLVMGGYNIHLTPVLSVWAQGALGYEHTSTSAGNTSASGYAIPFGIFVPFLYHPTEHFFLGLGPSLTTQLANSVEGMSQSKLTSIGLQSVVGGYFGP